MVWIKEKIFFVESPSSCYCCCRHVQVPSYYSFIMLYWTQSYEKINFLQGLGYSIPSLEHVLFIKTHLMAHALTGRGDGFSIRSAKKDRTPLISEFEMTDFCVSEKIF